MSFYILKNTYLQTFRQAQVLTSLVYKIDRTIVFDHRVYVFDIDCSREGHLCLSTIWSTVIESKFVLFQSQSGLYVALKEKGINRFPHYIYIYGYKNSVVKEQSKFSGFYNDCQLPILHKTDKPVVLWGENDKLTQGDQKSPLGCSPIFDYSPQGLTVLESGDILICLWNNKVGLQSLGKVISIDWGIEIFTDKNRPLYVCPTYIAENGNRDICVSDVNAVVVTDAGGMLRFRYQGNSGSSNFDPYGICCDSKSNIIVADMKNNKIHVVDKDGEFLHHVIYDGIKLPRALCIDKNDYVYVGEWDTDCIKVISR